MTLEEIALTLNVRERIYCDGSLSREMPEEMEVSQAEYLACEKAVMENMEMRGDVPILYTRTGKGILFKNVEIYAKW